MLRAQPLDTPKDGARSVLGQGWVTQRDLSVTPAEAVRDLGSRGHDEAYDLDDTFLGQPERRPGDAHRGDHVAVRAADGRGDVIASALYAQGRVHHVGAFAELEDEMCDFGPAGLSAGSSPDRLDALVWALTELMLQPRAEPRVRAV